MARLSLNDADKQVRDWFTKKATALGCKVTVDEMGNQFAVRPGMCSNLVSYSGSCSRREEQGRSTCHDR
jgi:putative aminopeptidase FrvX